MINITYKTLSEAFLDIHSYTEMHTFIENANHEINITSEEFKLRVLKILHYLQDKGINPGDEVVFQIKSNVDFIHIFWACILGRIIPVPYTYLESERDKSKLIKIWRNLNNPVLATDNSSFEQYKKFASKNNLDEFSSILSGAIITEDMNQLDENAQIVLPEETDVAFIQFSSGSTSAPKGVVITHKNIITSVKETLKAMNVSEEDIYLSWLPLTHSFGLIGTHMTPFLAKLKYYIMPTHVFTSNPILWLKKLAQHNATITAAPNFALKHVCKYLCFEKDMDIELSSLRIIINGAEPVSTSVCKDFLNKMSAYGMKETVVRPSYGLSEATLVVSTPESALKIKEVNLIRNNVKIGERVIESDVFSDDVISFAQVGKCLDNLELKIVDSSGKEVEDRVVGSVLLRGDMVFTGYYNNKKATEDAIDENGWFNTGDLGFLRDGSLVLTGRVKDVFFIKGENFYSHDIENICQQMNDVSISRIAACGLYNNKTKQDQLICFVEYEGCMEKFKDIAMRIKQQVVKKVGIGITHVIPINEIPVTVSGKIRRFILSQRFMDGEYDDLVYRTLS